MPLRCNLTVMHNGSAPSDRLPWAPHLGVLGSAFLRRRVSASLRSTSSPIEAWRRRRSPPPHATRPHSVPPSLSSRCSRLDQPAAARGCDASMPKMAFQSSSRDSFTGAAYAAVAINDSLSPLQHLGFMLRKQVFLLSCLSREDYLHHSGIQTSPIKEIMRSTTLQSDFKQITHKQLL
ncbi:uncharacterized protein LOC120692368 [Panicum virgatum]|uniref:Uncharacterized protein n=1 Tax=Panicum virgatum TaxID=38727 RepID=A0A8T0N552_PANVG|nr:uncharacterized protein LOC120692368 [Panicum virgatum]KAG2542166.1 hypothetical protein PVAP13_9NG570742 [Panicum virgatum]